MWDWLTASLVFHFLCRCVSAHFPNRRCQFFQMLNLSFWKENTLFFTAWWVIVFPENRLTGQVIRSHTLSAPFTLTLHWQDFYIHTVYRSADEVSEQENSWVCRSRQPVMLLFQLRTTVTPFKRIIYCIIFFIFKDTQPIVMFCVEAKSCHSWPEKVNDGG